MSAMETRNILDKDGTIIGELSLPLGTSETVWTEKLGDYIVQDPQPLTLEEIVSKKVDEAVDFGKKLVDEFLKENVLLGITQLGLTNHVRKTLREVKDAVDTGSLYDAISEIVVISLDDLDSNILTEERLLAFRNKIEIFLEIPLSEVWNQKETWIS